MSTIILKQSATASNVPTAGQLALGEVAINTADGKLYAKLGSGVVVDLVDHTSTTTGAEVKIAYEANADTNAYTDAEKTKLTGVATSANNYVHPATHSIAEVATLQTTLDAKEPANADILKANVADNLTVGFTTNTNVITYAATITPSLLVPWLQSCAITGNLTVNEPTDGTFGGCLILLTIDATGGYALSSGVGVTAIGTYPTLAANSTYEVKIVKHSNTLTTMEAVLVGV